jgi:pyruvate ferredoxin oxidoreductase gamma subunit
VVARDFLGLALETVGAAAGLAAALGAAAGALLGLSDRAIREALSAELAAIELPPERIEASLRLADLARAGLARLEIPPRGAPPPGAADRLPGPDVVEVAYAPPEVGAPTVTAAPNTRLRRTGSWRVFRPVIDLARCTRCWICFVRCPEGAITLDAEDAPAVDYEVCKGCLICVEECPPGVITSVRESHAWAETGGAS